jgi:hypothetical protein
VRKALGVALLAAAPVLWRRRRDALRERVDVVFDDGSAVSLEQGPDAEALLDAARRAL